MKVFEAGSICDRKIASQLMRLADDSESQIESYRHLGRRFLLQDKAETLPIVRF